MLNVILLSSGFLVASHLWCKRAGWGGLRRREYSMIACGFLVFIACFGVQCGLRLGLCVRILFILICWIIFEKSWCAWRYTLRWWEVGVMLFYFINLLRLLYELCKWIMHVLDYWRCNTLNLVLLLNTPSGHIYK